MAEVSTLGVSSFIVPSGENIYSGLRSAIVKMDGLLAHLEAEKFNGYILLHGEDARSTQGLLLLRGGQVIGATYGEEWGDEAQARIGERVAYQAGKMDVVRLTPETVSVLAASFGQRIPYTDLHTSFIDLSRLTAYLSSIDFSGSINVAGSDGRGAVLMSGGRVVGFYTGGHPAMTTDSAAVAAIWADGEAAIWINSVVLR